ncbi:MAG: GHKL domain-containing protein [Proteobacteria bacterium]|nr:GHKL domain-containing protein [Pseudomonadota bacterium]
MIQKFTPSIRTYLILMNFILLFLLFPSTILLLLQQEAKNRDVELKRNLNQIRFNLESRRATLTRNMALSAGQAIAGYDFTFLNILVDQVVEDDPEIIYCIIMSKDRIALAHSDHQKIGSFLNSQIDDQAANILNNDFEASISEKKSSTSIQSGRGIRFIESFFQENDGKEPMMESIAPVYNGNELWGAIRCGYSLKSILNEIHKAKEDWDAKVEQYKLFLITTIGIFFSIACVAAVLFTRLFVKPLRILSDGVSRIADGNLEHPIEQKGLVFKEFMELSNAFNVMTDKLKTSYHELGEYNRFLEKKVAERTMALKEAQDHLLRQAHEAGMAEMAVGMLHNIGNAITPAGVSASLLLKKFRESPIRRGFDQASRQILSVIEHSSLYDASEIDRLCQIVRLLSESIREEYNHAMAEINKIQSTHEHIESIIHLQMQYGIFGDFDKININLIVEDALKMLNDSIEKRKIKVIKNLSASSLVRIQKARLIQILVNLIKNSIESMENVSENNRILTISTRCDEKQDDIVLTIGDSGIGFSDEEKEKLFRFGYTTKAKGTGFGLHSCANYLIASNGSISAFSAQKGKGAVFTIRLPKDTSPNQL